MAKQSKPLLESLRLDRSNKQVWKGRVPHHRTRTPFEVLCYLVERKGHLVKKGELLDKFWGADRYEQALTKCISEIRTVRKDNPTTPHYLRTDSGYGYRFIGPLVNYAPSMINAESGVSAQES